MSYTVVIGKTVERHHTAEQAARRAAEVIRNPHPPQKNLIDEPEQKPKQDLRRLWEIAVSNEKVADFKKYNPNHSYNVGDLIIHPKLGDGKVTEVHKDYIIALLFDGYHKLGKSTSN